ncbi:MAG: hypothetical protein ACI4MA_04330 [Treponema sp.]
MKTKRSSNTLRHFFGFVMLCMMVLCFSCDNLFSLKSSNDSSTGEEKEFSRNSKYTISGNIVLKGALPAELIAGGTTNSKSSSIAKSAAPSTSSSITYTLAFTDSSNTTNNKTVSLTQGDANFLVELNKGTYELSVTGCDSSGNEIVSGKASSTFILSDTNKTVSDLTVSVAPISTGSGTGTVYLTLNLTGCGIRSYKATWNENGTEKVTTFNDSGSDLSTHHFYMVANDESSVTNPPQAVGLYEVHFTFYNSLTQDGSTEVFSCTEYISVFQNMTTDTWVNDANTSYISGGSFTLTQDIIENRHKFYVDQINGSSTNNGSYFNPLDSVKTAVAKVCSQNDGAPYTIVLLSDDSENPSAASYTGSTPAYIQISPAENLYLTIEGDKTTGVRRTINANRSSTNEGGVIYIGSNANVTIDNLNVTGGYLSSYNGGGIRNDGTLQIKNCDVVNNTANCGGAIYTCASLTINEALISENIATDKGGGIYSENSLSAFDFGSAVCFAGNMASSGSAIYSQDAVNLVELLCTFDDDGDGSFSTPEKNTADDGTLMVFAGTSDTTTLNFHSGFNMSADNSICIAAVDGSSLGDSVTQIHLAESLANFSDSKKIKIVPSPYPTASAIQVFSADSSLSAADEYAKFSVPDDNSGNEYKITDDGKISPVVTVTVYTDWETLVDAVAAIPTGTTTVTEFEIGSDMTMTCELLSDKPIRLYAKNSYTLTLDTSVTGTVFEPNAALTIEGVDGAQLTFDGNYVSSLASFISLNYTAEATFNNITFTNFNASTDGSVVSVTSATVGCSATFADCNFSSNKVTGSFDGGAVCIAGNSTLTFNQCNFTSNSSELSGGAVAVEHNNASAVINDCTFTSNDAGSDKQGGGIYVYKGSCKINGVTMSSNSAGTFAPNDIYYYIPSTNPELTLSGKCTIPAVHYNVSNLSTAPSIMKIESLDTASSVGIQISTYAYTLTNEVIQSSDGATDISSLLRCFSVIDAGYALTLNASNTGMYLTAITGLKAAPDSVGDIVFSDGAACAYTETLTSAQKAAAVAVIFYAGTETDSLGKRVLGVGLKNSYGDGTGTMQWCSGSADGYYNLADLVCEATTDSVTSAEFSGDLNGSDNWNVVQTNCRDTSDIATNYPAWDYAVNYGTRNWSGTPYESGWYLPTVAEFAELYNNKLTVNEGLTAAGAEPVTSEMVGFWTSTQYSSGISTSVNEAINVWQDDGTIGNIDKAGNQKYVLAVREF